MIKTFQISNYLCFNKQHIHKMNSLRTHPTPNQLILYYSSINRMRIIGLVFIGLGRSTFYCMVGLLFIFALTGFIGLSVHQLF